MKKLFLPVIALIVALSMLLSSCGQAPSGPCAHIDSDNDLSCDYCGCFVDAAVEGWLIDDIPAYQGGTLSSNRYLAGQGIDTEQSLENEGVLQAVSNTTAAEFGAYLSKLEKAGYEQEFYRSVDDNFFASYISGDIRVYAYFMSRTKEVRIIQESARISSSLTDFGYVYEKKQGEQTVVYQIAFAMTDETHPKPGFKDNGMIYVIKFADNSLMVIDGANSNQLTKERNKELMNMFWEITGKQEGETVKIAGWFITHSHVDHYNGFTNFIKQNSKHLDLERVFFALPSLHSTNEAVLSSSGPGGYRVIIETINDFCSDDDTIFLRLHTGQTIQLADVSMEVLQTQEDLVSASTGDSLIKNYNDASTVLRLTVDGETFLVLGDAGAGKAMPKLLNNWSNEHLRSDAVQLAHHVMNDVRPLYKIVQAPVLFVPQSRYSISIKQERIDIFNAAKSYAREDMIFFQNEETVGIAVVNGQWEKVYSVPFTY